MSKSEHKGKPAVRRLDIEGIVRKVEDSFGSKALGSQKRGLSDLSDRQKEGRTGKSLINQGCPSCPTCPTEKQESDKSTRMNTERAAAANTDLDDKKRPGRLDVEGIVRAVRESFRRQEAERSGGSDAGSRDGTADAAVTTKELGKRVLPSAPPVCAVCGVADWLVVLTMPDGRKMHMPCSGFSAVEREKAARQGELGTGGLGGPKGCC